MLKTVLKTMLTTHNVIAYNINAGRNTLYTRVPELTFKRHVMSSATGTAVIGGFFCMEKVYEYFYLF